MANSKGNKLTKEARIFLEPKSPTHRQYEALRAYFVERLSSDEAAQRFGYTPGSFRVLCHEFRTYDLRQLESPKQAGCGVHHPQTPLSEYAP